MNEPRAIIPALPGGPDPSAPVPRAPVEGFDLVAYASAAARLAQRGTPRAAVLAELRLNETRWLTIEKTWLLRIATALLQQDVSLPQDYDAAYGAAQAALASR